MSAPQENNTADAAVNDVTAALSNTAISEKPADASAPAPAEGCRLYIGNLAYATTEEGLKEFFKGYLVIHIHIHDSKLPAPSKTCPADILVSSSESVTIPKNPRTERSVGYAFVDLSTPTEAERAIAELSGKEILERKVSVQLARKPEPNAEKTDANGEGEGTRRRQSTRGRGRGNRARGGRPGRAREDKKEEGADSAAAAPADAAAATEVQPLQDITNKTNNADPDGKTKNQARPARERRERGPPADGIPSKTKVMVANLPYDLTEEKLKELFDAYEPSSAKIALRPIPRFMIKKLQARGEARKGRGFGFVTLASEELQQKAVSEMNGKEIEGREIAVKVAIDSPDKTDEEANAPAEQGENGAEPAAEEAAATAA
ncbi:Single-stranded TG1-3 DNA-binding protein [Cytospora mali]|uniref:Single-stranded TG1-3 DNA-binding protein n=1 Tax=Cytospora mali TaxID=578113 RepID=A0A194UT52_CYTMA|nr:Single-stranded TG1-3 DNA-binding protein [Valsa mali var. pyri (nom. inval.)]